MPKFIHKPILLSLVGFLFILTACDGEIPASMSVVQLQNNESKITFAFPSEYKNRANSDSLMVLHCRYPAMTPRNADKVIEEDSITI